MSHKYRVLYDFAEHCFVIASKLTKRTLGKGQADRVWDEDRAFEKSYAKQAANLLKPHTKREKRIIRQEWARVPVE